jgi:hypothetical protein
MAEVLTEVHPSIVEVIGEIEPAKRGRVLRVALVDWGNDLGIGIDVRVFVTDAAPRSQQGRAVEDRETRSGVQGTAERPLHGTDETGHLDAAQRR